MIYKTLHRKLKIE